MYNNTYHRYTYNTSKEQVYCISHKATKLIEWNIFVHMNLCKKKKSCP